MACSAIHFPQERILTCLRRAIGGLFIFALAIFGSAFLEKGSFPKKERIFYVLPFEYVQPLSGTFRSFWADIFYIRGVLEITEEIKDRDFWVDWVQKNFELATRLDPELIQGYFFAGVVIVNNKSLLHKGIQFLEKGLLRNPHRWEIPYWLGFNYYQSGDFLKAAQYYQRAAQFAGAPAFLKSNPAVFYYRAKRPDLGVIYLEGLKQSVKDPRQLEWLEIKLKWLKDIVALEEIIGQYKIIYGKPPEDLEKLVDAGLLKEIPVDIFSGGYYLDAASGRVKSRFEQDRTSSKPPAGECSSCKR